MVRLIGIILIEWLQQKLSLLQYKCCMLTKLSCKLKTPECMHDAQGHLCINMGNNDRECGKAVPRQCQRAGLLQAMQDTGRHSQRASRKRSCLLYSDHVKCLAHQAQAALQHCHIGSSAAEMQF